MNELLGRSRTVLLVHGLARTGRAMEPLAGYLADRGFSPRVFSYSSRSLTVGEAAGRLGEAIHGLAEAGAAPVHVVAHSLGSLLTRTHAKDEGPGLLGRVVFLAPPGHGSEVADRLARHPWFRLLYGPAGQELRTGPQGVAGGLPPVDFPCGVLAGTKSRSLLARRWLAPPHDGRVTVQSARIPGIADFRELPVTHNGILANREALALTALFLLTGSFGA